MVDPTIIAVPIAVVLLWVLRSHHLIADLPIWVLVVLVAGASILTAVANEAWPENLTGWRLYMRVGAELTGITIVIYAVGWGPTLVVGLVFGVADCMRSVGAATTKPAIILSAILIGAGQIGIAIGVVPTLVPQPFVQALAVLALAGLVFTIQLIGWVFGAKELSDTALGEAEARFKSSFDGAPIGICLVGTDGTILQANPSFGSILGYQPGELVGVGIESLTHPDDRQFSEIVDPSSVCFRRRHPSARGALRPCRRPCRVGVAQREPDQRSPREPQSTASARSRTSPSVEP